MTDIGRLRSEIETLRTQSGSLFDAIQHGDDEHRAWLKAAITAHFAGEPVPSVSGSGRKDAEIETLRARLAAAERVVEAARKANFSGQIYEATWIDDLLKSIAAYDQGKVTICDSAPTEGQ